MILAGEPNFAVLRRFRRAVAIVMNKHAAVALAARLPPGRLQRRAGLFHRTVDEASVGDILVETFVLLL